MKIIDCLVKVFENPDDEVPTSDVLCKVITMCQEQFSQGSGEFAINEQYMAVYVFNPITGEVQNVRLRDIVINSYMEDNSKEVITVENPLRVAAE